MKNFIFALFVCFGLAGCDVTTTGPDGTPIDYTRTDFLSGYKHGYLTSPTEWSDGTPILLQYEIVDENTLVLHYAVQRNIFDIRMLLVRPVDHDDCKITLRLTSEDANNRVFTYDHVDPVCTDAPPNTTSYDVLITSYVLTQSVKYPNQFQVDAATSWRDITTNEIVRSYTYNIVGGF